MGGAHGNRYAALEVEEPTTCLETVRHVVTECDATAGRTEAAEYMEDMCRRAHADLAGEAGEAPARAAIELARVGWEAVRAGRRPTDPQWHAMHRLLGGAIPVWHGGTGGQRGEERARAREVARRVRGMQARAMQRVEAHVRRGAKGRKWIEERERARPLLRLVLSAWAAGTRSGQAGRPWCAPQLSDAAWQAQRAKETRRASRARRLNEAAQRLVMFGRLMFAPHLREKKKQARLQTKAKPSNRSQASPRE